MAKLLDYVKDKTKIPFELVSDPTKVYRFKDDKLEKHDGSKWVLSADQFDPNADLFQDAELGLHKIITEEIVQFADPVKTEAKDPYLVIKRSVQVQAL